MFFLKFPKTGGNFATTLAYSVCAEHLNGSMIRTPHDVIPKLKNSSASWNERCHGNYFSRFVSGHTPMKKEEHAQHAGHLVSLFRKPKQRIVSGWYHDKHDCEWAEDIKVYKSCVGSCYANMLTGQECGSRTAPDYEKALRRLEHDYAFIGITDEYDLSVCLFHAMFPTLGKCREVEFGNARVGSNHTPGSKYDAASLLGDGFAPGDGPIYAKALEIFQANLKKYNVNRETCEKVHCRDAARFFQVDATFRLAEGSNMYDWPGRFEYDAEAFQ
jgi:hypothetical protein